MNEAKRRETVFFLIVIASIVIVFGSLASCGMAMKANDKRRAEYVQRFQCKVVGYYGNGGQYKVFQCLTGLKREYDI